MSSPLSSFPCSPSAVSEDQRLLNGLYSLLPAPNNEHLAFRFLLDAESRIRLSLSTNSLLLDELAERDMTPLSIAKLRLLKILNPAWHPILDVCEQQLATCSNVLPTGLSPPLQFLGSTSPTVHDGISLYPTTIPPDHRQYSPLDFNPDIEGHPLDCAGHGYSSDDPQCCPATHNDDHLDRWSESSAPFHGLSSVSPAGAAIPAAGAEIKNPAPICDNMESDPSSTHAYMVDVAPLPTPFCPIMAEESSSSTSTYSSLLPERHCPPFANLVRPSLGFTTPPPSFDLSTVALSTDPSAEPWVVEPIVCDGIDPRHHIISRQSNSFDIFPTDLIARAILGDPQRSMAVEEPNPSDLSSFMAASHVSTEHDTRGPMSDVILSFEHGSGDTTVTDTSRTRKRSKRVFERPPGLPFGPWTPNDVGPFPEELPLKKPRKVRRAPSHEPKPGLQQGHKVKVPCPKCDTMVLPKSLTRHMERHSNWAEGKYNAHLYCRYCFAAYSRMDLLIRHQKTDAQCVMLQYKVYWKGRKAYLEEQFQHWRIAANHSQ